MSCNGNIFSRLPLKLSLLAEELRAAALKRYQAVCPDEVESLVSCSDDNTLYLWRNNQNKCVERMTGHQNVVNDVKYSPDVKLIASASFDKSVRLWRAHDGQFIATFRGHVQAVYTLAWSADSRLIVSGSKDSTLKGKRRFSHSCFATNPPIHPCSLECADQEVGTGAAWTCG